MTKIRLKRLLVWCLACLIFGCVVLFLWSNWPISADPDRPDPAVVAANQIGEPDHLYSEGYAGEEGSRIHYVSAGQGEPIIFVHGFPSYWFSMFGLMEAFKSDYRVIAIDGLGVGRSDAPGSVNDYHIKHLIASIDKVVTELDLETVHLVGHDWGVALVTGYAQANPSKVKTVTTLSALPHNIVLSRVETDTAHQDLFSYTKTFARANPALIKLMGIKGSIWEDIYAPLVDQGFITEKEGAQFQRDVGNPRRLNRFIHWYRANFPDVKDIDESDFWPEREARLTVPAIFIYGENDPVVTDKLVEDFQALSEALTVIKLDDTGHRPHMEKRAEVIAHIRDLIETHK